MSTANLPVRMLDLKTMAVVVRDEKKAAKWYHDKLGLRIVTRFPHWYTVATRGSAVSLHLCPDSKPEKGNTGIAFSTKGAAKQEKEFRKKGVKITVPTSTEEWGTYFMFADPDGNEFWVLEE
jgi:predicted enzyme related to lactoylglutathione lyase